MPQLPPAPGVAQVAFNYLQDGQEVKNIINFRADAIIETATIQQLAADVEGWWRTHLRPLQTTALSLRSLTIRDLGILGGPAILHNIASPQAGSASGTAMPNSVTCVVSMRTPFAGKSFRGRIYHLGLITSNVTANTVGSAHLALITAAYAQLLAFAVGPGETPFKPGVLSYWANGALRAAPVFTEATLFTSDGIIDSQRRRLPGRGR